MAGLFGGNAFRVFDQVLGGRTISDARDYVAARDAEKAQSAQLQRYIEQNVTDPNERMIAMANPKAWSDARAERYKPMQVTKGNTVRYGPGESDFTAPEMGIAADQFYTQTPGGVNITGTRAPSFDEKSSAAKRIADMEAELQRLKIAAGQLDVSRGQLGINQAAHAARVAAGGYGTPGMGAVANSQNPDDYDWEPPSQGAR